ncbi:MAG: NRAMP family divalent metal transporter [Chloroflexota bacterium]
MSPRQLLSHLGPGIISGLSDLDPTTVATLAIVGSLLGYQLLWLILLLLPMLVTVQVVSARVGMVAEQGLEAVIRERFGQRWAMVAMLLVVSVNLLTLAADLEGGAAALGILTGLDWRWLVPLLALILGALLLFGGYYGVQRVLRYVLVVFGAYVAAAFLARPDWGQVLQSMLVPTLSTSTTYVAGALAILGTTLTSYVYFWETIEVQEERRPMAYLWIVELDAAVGMVATVALSAFIVITTAATLGVRGETVQTAEDAAAALMPVAGPFAGYLFALGLLASAVLAIPVLASTTAYVLADAFQWDTAGPASGRDGRPFYLVLLGSLALGTLVALLGIEPFHLLFFAGIVGGLGTPVLLGMLLLAARDPEIMCDQQIDRGLAVLGWLTTAVVGGAGLLYLAQQLL